MGTRRGQGGGTPHSTREGFPVAHGPCGKDPPPAVPGSLSHHPGARRALRWPEGPVVSAGLLRLLGPGSERPFLPLCTLFPGSGAPGQPAPSAPSCVPRGQLGPGCSAGHRPRRPEGPRLACPRLAAPPPRPCFGFVPGLGRARWLSGGQRLPPVLSARAPLQVEAGDWQPRCSAGRGSWTRSRVGAGGLWWPAGQTALLTGAGGPSWVPTLVQWTGHCLGRCLPGFEPQHAVCPPPESTGLSRARCGPKADAVEGQLPGRGASPAVTSASDPPWPR